MDLATRLASLRDKEKLTKPFPLSAYLTIFSKARHDCYVDYMEGAKVLHSWLNGTYPDKLPANYHDIPQLLISYEVSELAKIVSANAHGSGNTQATKDIISILYTHIYTSGN